MRAVWIDEPGQLWMRAAEPVKPGPGEALIRVAYAGICGSDREILNGTRPTGYVRYPIIPGHEWSGTVEMVGEDVREDLVGRKVVGEGFRACRVCAMCRAGDTNLCERPYDETGFTRPGAWADHLTLPANLLHLLPDDADLRAAALIEPAACAAAAFLKAGVQPGERAAVVGAGTIGLLATQFLAAAGAEVTVIERLEHRRELALRSGATRASPNPIRRDMDVVIEAAGTDGSALLATWLLRRGGRVVLAGIAADDPDPPTPAELVTNQLTVHTVFGAPTRAWTYAVKALSDGLIRPRLLVTHEIPLDAVTTAFELRDAVKVLLRP